MRRFFIIFVLFTICVMSEAQTAKHSLVFYVEKAFQGSPLLSDESNQTEILNSEKRYLHNVYTHAQTLLTGNYLFVPIIERTSGTTSFKWNAQSTEDYYGYDLGVSNGNLQIGLTWNKPLLGNNIYKVAESQINIQHDVLKNDMRMSRHDIERNVTDQYILCMLDKRQISMSDSISALLSVQAAFIARLARTGQAKQSDLQAILIEQNANKEMKLSHAQSYYNHLMELNTLCCIHDTANIQLEDEPITKNYAIGTSQFLVKYDLDSMSTVNGQKMYETKYKPQLNLFTNFGIQTTNYNTIYKNFGMSAGLTLSVLLSDGKLKKIKQHQTDAALASIALYKNNLARQNEIRLNQCSAVIKDYDVRIGMLDNQLKEYTKLLDICRREIMAGQISVFDYITTLKNIISARQQMMIVEANRQLAINAFNYYNW